VDPDLFAADLARKPSALAALGDDLSQSDPWTGLPGPHRPRIVFVGMGSSHYASSVAAARLRSQGIDAVAELASSDLLPQPTPATVVIAVSASGGSVETLDAVGRLVGSAGLVVVTNQPSSALAQRADLVVALGAGEERGGVACITYAHTLGLLLRLETHLAGKGRDHGRLLRSAATATRHLLDTSDEWLPRATDLVAGPDGTHVVAPARRLSSALQSALMLREGPRRAAVGCETGDWSHVDVYLTKNTDYRLLLMVGSRWETGLLDWTRQRSTTLVAVGGETEGAALTIRYPGDHDDDVRLLTETTVAELVAARLWGATALR
jgi:glucosamine 6-phosphate synthetase-like amidotransferase/phosphosugar isomerase protein